jgi:polyferredoxin
MVASVYLLPIMFLVATVLLLGRGVNLPVGKALGTWMLAFSVFSHVFNKELNALKKHQYVGEDYKWRWLERLVPDFINKIPVRTVGRFMPAIAFVFGIALILGFMD